MKSDEWSQAKDVGSSVWEAVKRSGDGIAQAAKRLAQLQRIQAQMQKLRTRRRNTLYAIGEQVYALHGRGKVRNRDVLKSCGELDLIARQLADLHRQVEELREQARQPCATQEPVDDSFLTDDDDLDEATDDVEISGPEDEQEEAGQPEDDQEPAEEVEAQEPEHEQHDDYGDDQHEGHEDDEHQH